ncbi:MAG: glycosyltransferase [Planctomycetota bacterium]|nr:glycosyltransferase [Planctomycetota bacterium]
MKADEIDSATPQPEETPVDRTHNPRSQPTGENEADPYAAQRAEKQARKRAQAAAAAGQSKEDDESAPTAEELPKPKKQKSPKVVARVDVAAPELDPARDIEVTIIVPIQTGDGRVRDVVEALGSELERLGRNWECILVFDGVRGPAWEDAHRLAREKPGRVHPIAFQQPAGESTCLTAAFERARGSIIVTSPQYVQVDPFELSRMLALVDGGADFVSPWRHPRIDPYLNRIQSALFNWVMRRIMHAPFHDLNCYFRVFRRGVLEDVAIYGDQYRFLPAIALRQGFKVVELKVRHLKEWGGKGFFGLGVYARRFLDILGVVFLSKFTLKPLRFFGTLGGICALIGGAVCLSRVASKWILETEGALLGPIFMLGALLFVLGVQIIGFGLVGEIIIYTQARNLREYRIERIWESGPKKHDDDPDRTAAVEPLDPSRTTGGDGGSS